jgi:hypothetical protein
MGIPAALLALTTTFLHWYYSSVRLPVLHPFPCHRWEEEVSGVLLPSCCLYRPGCCLLFSAFTCPVYYMAATFLELTTNVRTYGI